jgi:hypothetical protein
VFCVGWFFGVIVFVLLLLVAVLLICVAILAIPGVPLGLATSAWYKGVKAIMEDKKNGS